MKWESWEHLKAWDGATGDFGGFGCVTRCHQTVSPVVSMVHDFHGSVVSVKFLFATLRIDDMVVGPNHCTFSWTLPQTWRCFETTLERSTPCPPWTTRPSKLLHMSKDSLPLNVCKGLDVTVAGRFHDRHDVGGSMRVPRSSYATLWPFTRHDSPSILRDDGSSKWSNNERIQWYH